MAKETDNLMLEHLRSIRTDVGKLSQRIDNLTAEVRVVKGHVATLVQSDLNRDDRFANLEIRLDRIEKRLELAD